MNRASSPRCYTLPGAPGAVRLRSVRPPPGPRTRSSTASLRSLDATASQKRLHVRRVRRPSQPQEIPWLAKPTTGSTTADSGGPFELEANVDHALAAAG